MKRLRSVSLAFQNIPYSCENCGVCWNYRHQYVKPLESLMNLPLNIVSRSSDVYKSAIWYITSGLLRNTE